MTMKNPQIIKILNPNLKISNSSTLQWLISSPFFPKFTIVSTIRCLHFQPSDHLTPHFSKESDDLRSLIVRGFHVIGALIPAQNDVVSDAKHAINAARELRKGLYSDVENSGKIDLVGGVLSSNGGVIWFFGSKDGEFNNVEEIEEVVYEEKEKAEKFVWERGCLIKCGISVNLPVYVNLNKEQDAIQKYLREHEGLVSMFKDPQTTYIVTSSKSSSEDLPRPVVVRGSELDFESDISDIKVLTDTSTKSGEIPIHCSYFCSESKHHLSGVGAENADTIQVTLFLNRSGESQQSVAPVVEYCPALEAVKLMVVNYNLEVICYAVKDLPLTYSISRLVIPALVDQLTTVKNIVSPSFLSKHPQLHPYHFCPPGFVHPITALYELSYGETELKQVEVRRSLHLRLGLPSDRPLLRTANALCFSKSSNNEVGSARKGYPLLRDVHVSIPSSGVSGGLVSLVQGSYEYHHYLQGGFDDSGWGCAYRSLQTIISWFRLQHYTSIDVPTHREIQEALVEIGDKDPSFIGSREWIGAIELSYVLDKLLGVTCKVMTLRSGAEFPEKCRELALHFENQGTPIMIGGGVLAYTLLGVDYNDASGDSAFLILDPHYTGGEDIKKIVNGGWCGWKKAVDSKGKAFFLADKFYNLLLPQRPNMV